MVSNLKAILITSLLLAAAFSAAADIVSLRLDDNRGSFVTSTPGLPDDSWTAPPAGDADDTWGFSGTNTQALFGSGETANLSQQVWVARVDLGESVPDLTTTVSGLSADVTYDIYGYYVSSTGQNWGIAIGLDGGGLTKYDINDGIQLENDPGGTNFHQVFLGRITDRSSFTLKWSAVENSGTTPRSFIKGIGIEAVPGTSEPDESPFQVPSAGNQNELLGGRDIVAPLAMAFDSLNRPYLVDHVEPDGPAQLHTVRDGAWITQSLGAYIPQSAYNMHDRDDLVTMAVDDEDALYILWDGILLYSPDLGESYYSYDIGDGGIYLELRTGPHGELDGPPAILQHQADYIDRDQYPWARTGPMSIYLPEKNTDGTGLNIGAPILISEIAMAGKSGGHSGGTSFGVSKEGKLHMAYVRTPDDLVSGGNPVYAVTIDRASRTITDEVFLVNAPPDVPDIHTVPTITIDSQGYLHVLTGSHGQAFYYLKSQQAKRIDGGWTTPEALVNDQTYASIVCDANDRLHTVYRLWAPRANLAYSYADAGDFNWTGADIIVKPPAPVVDYYGVYYHRLYIDRLSNLYVRFTFWERGLASTDPYPDALIVSKDGGQTWQLAGKSTLIQESQADPGAGDYADWIAEHGAGLSQQGMAEDPDADGLPNAVEAWFGTDPGAFSAGFGSFRISDSDPRVVSFNHPMSDSPPVDVSGSYQWSPNLVDWYAGDGIDGPAGGGTVFFEATQSNQTAEVTATSSAPMPQIFVRFLVETR